MFLRLSAGRFRRFVYIGQPDLVTRTRHDPAMRAPYARTLSCLSAGTKSVQDAVRNQWRPTLARYEFIEDSKGGVGMEIIARDHDEMFNAAAAALCLFMWEQDTVEEREEVEIAWYGFDVPTTVVGLLSELLYRMDSGGWVFKRFVTRSLEEVDELDERHRRKQMKISGTAYGEKFDATRHRRRFPVQAVLMPRLKVDEHAEGVRLYCILDA